MNGNGEWQRDSSWDDWGAWDGSGGSAAGPTTPGPTTPGPTTPGTPVPGPPAADTWVDHGPAVDAWYADPQGEYWSSPTEAPRRSRALPIALGVTAAVLGVAVVGAGAWFVLGGERNGQDGVVEAATTGSAGQWNTPTVAPTSTSAPVRPASAECAVEDIAADTSVRSPAVRHCYGDWAVVVDEVGSGDAIVLRKTGGAWQFVGSPSGGCPDEGIRSAMPVALVSEFYGPTCTARTSSGVRSSAPSAPAARANSVRSAPGDRGAQVSRSSSSRAAPAPAPGPAPARPPAPEPPPPPPPPPPAPEPDPAPPRDTEQDLQDLEDAAGDLLDALDGARTPTDDEN